MFKFSMERSQELFGGPINVHALLFADYEGKDYEKVAGAVKDAAIKYRTQVSGGVGRKGRDGRQMHPSLV